MRDEHYSCVRRGILYDSKWTTNGLGLLRPIFNRDSARKFPYMLAVTVVYCQNSLASTTIFNDWCYGT
uniref:Uncharacterized protein n=1 Tax=Arundo donax TaxID=35708 RepID=A0A0A9FVN9_ARUDO